MALQRTGVSEPGVPPVAPDSVNSKPTKTRWWVLILISVMYLICYMDRSNISVAQPEIAKAFGFSKGQMGVILAAFTWAYALGQVPAGWFGDKYGPKKVLGVLVAWRSTAAIATGAALGFPTLFGARFMLGLGEAGAFPVASRGMQTWFAKSERGRIQGIVHFFSRFALAITPFVSGHILLALGWRWIFYIFGSMGILWAVVFSTIFRDHPEDHPGVNQAELAEIRGLNADGTTKALDRSRPPTPWKAIIGSPNMWFIAIGYGCFFFGSNFYLTWYPTYLREYRHLSIQSLGLLGSLPLFIGMTGDVVGGWLTDKIYHKTGNARLARRAVAAPAFVLAGVFSIPAAMTTDTLTSLLFLAASFFSLEMVIGPAWAVPMDVGGQFSGTVTGIMNMFGALAASMTALIYGYMFGKEMWVAPFILSAGVMVLGALIWTFLIDPEKSVVGG